ncbi:MAG: MATE family efflux transporter [Lachnospiraceae bacterium]|nr:MATE family efflux transporter [Lachnospiraceae bacterium]MDD3617237.1 MATE family efflux transporter [Lachnospiraceae bacterium]
MNKEVTMNKMGTEPIPKVMLSMGIPMILSMVLQACYNIVDSMFVARMPDTDGIVHAGEYAVNALTLAFPVQMLIVAFGIGTGVGVNVLLSMHLGQGNHEKVAKVAGNGIVLGMIMYAVFFIFGLVGIDVYLKSQSTDPIVLSMGKSYLTICTLLCFGMVMFSIYEKLLQATGKTLYSTIAQVAGAVVNIVLDPILIYGLLGLPSLGVAGAAYATVIGQVTSFLIALFLHMKKNKEVKSGLVYMKLDSMTVGAIYKIGLPAIIMQALMSVMTYGINIIFGGVSMACVTAYGIFYKIQQFLFFAAFGLRDAITPIVSFNYGMGSKKRVKSGIRYGLIYTLLIMIVGIVVLQVFAEPLVAVFGLSDETADLCILAIRIITAGFVFAGGNIALQGVLQALGCGIGSLVISILRLLIVVLPLAWVFAQMSRAAFFIWFAFPIAEMVAVAAAILLMIRADKNIICKM